MTVNYSVTFEFATRPPLTHRGQVSAFSAETCMARATREARALLKPKAWDSCVCVLLERLEDAETGSEAEPEADTADA